ncbi:hypothetical protein ACFSL6_17505 [Paenibacillus thailandensis]|uniref:Uncharacterized protein n=1 Tax=Paenibacillus thailandensis TaxID=393250 RepID=A0ABW5R216_9BACL
MSKTQVIQSITVGQNLQRKYTIGDVVNGAELNEIKNMSTVSESRVFSEYWLLDEDGNILSSVENMPVVIDYQTIAVDDEEENHG